MSRSDGMKVSGKMKIDLIHGEHLGISSSGSSPFIPKHGPRDGSRRATIAFFPILLSPNARPIDTVVLPIPAFVAVMAVTNIRLLFFTFSSSINCSGIFAM